MKNLSSRWKYYTGLVVFCCFYWLLDSIWSVYSFERNLQALAFNEPGSWLDTLLLRVPPYQAVSRLMVVMLFLTGGALLFEFVLRKRYAEHALDEMSRTLLTVLNSIEAAIYVADMDTFKILFANRYLRRRAGEDLEGRLCHEALAGSNAPCWNCTRQRLVDSTGNPSGVVAREDYNPISHRWYLKHDRAIRWIDGRVVYLQIATDISDVKELQESQRLTESRVRDSQKMESIGTLAGGIAHDFNNILSSVIGYTELAMEDAEPDSDMADNLNEVYTAGMRAKELVRQILTFARQVVEDARPVCVADIADEVLKLVRASIPATIEIVRRVESEAHIMADPTQIHQVLLNLCTNAAQAMEKEGGTLTLGLREITLPEDNPEMVVSTPGPHLELTVADTGCGIAPHLLDSIFHPFFTTKKPGEGTGMGLPMVHGIVMGCEGGVAVQSTPGRGSQFTVCLPVAPERMTEIEAAAESVPRGCEHILLVDDEAPVLKMQRLMLERLGYKVTARTSSLEALALFTAHPDRFDLLLTDMTMPAMPGDRLAREIMTLRPAMPVVLLSGYSKRMSEEKARDMGIRAFLYKPAVREQLAREIRRALDDATPLPLTDPS